MNLLLVSLDSVRLDFVSRASRLVKTPLFDALTQGFHFSDRFFSVSSATRPVHTSLFTGLYPFEHGVLGQDWPLMRGNIPQLFALFVRQGFRVAAFSQAHEIFSGLDYAPFLQPLGHDDQPLFRFVQDRPPSPRFLFVHYWSAHPPYGAADAKALGQTLRLLEEGQQRTVQARYARAIEELCETRLAPLLERLDLDQWCVVIFSDHGQSWTPAEPYHGQTLRNSVLRVPLYLHIPNTGNPPPPRPLLCTIDLFPTLVGLFGLRTEYQGFGRDLRRENGAYPCLAQIHPIRDQRPAGAQQALLLGPARQGPQWALFDAERKFTYDEESQQGRLENTWTEEPVADKEAEAFYRDLYAHLQASSAYAGLPLASPLPGQQALLERRLRDLGYLE